MNDRLRRGIGAVGAVLAAGALAACSASPDPIATGMASGPTEAQLQAGDDFGRWVDRLHHTDELDFDERAIDRITHPTDWDDDVESVKDLADSYPVAGSTLPALLDDAAEARSAALVSYRERDFTGGERSAKLAASTMRKAHTVLTADVARVEADCDCRVVMEGWFGHPEPLSAVGSEDVAEVVEWIDGDTVETTEGRVRLIGVDTPELSDECSQADDAKRNAEAIAPPGTEVDLVAPVSVDNKDRYGRLLRYVEVPQERESGSLSFIDVGYSQILSGLAVARYDSQDGYQWHPREGDYRDASGTVGPDQLKCLAPAAETANEAGEEDEDNDRRPVLQIVSALFTQQIDDADNSAGVARQSWTDRDELDRSLDALRSEKGGGNGGGHSGGNYRYCRGWFCVG